MEYISVDPQVTLSLDEIGAKCHDCLTDWTQTTITYLLELGRLTSQAWEKCIDIAKEENPNRYIKRARTLFKEWKQQFQGNWAQVAFNFYCWYKELPEKFQKDLYHLNHWSKSALKQLTKTVEGVARYLIKEGKNGVKHTIKSIKCSFDSPVQKYLCEGERMLCCDWQLIQHKIKKVSPENLPAIEELATKMAVEASRPVCEATGKIEPYTDDAIAALDKLGYKTRSLIKPEPKKYTESYVQALQERIEDLENANTANTSNSKNDDQHSEDFSPPTEAQLENIKQEYETKLEEIQQKYEALLEEMKQKNFEQINPLNIVNNEIEHQDNNNELKFSKNARVAITEDNFVAEGQVVAQVGESVSVRLTSGQIKMYHFTKLRLFKNGSKSQKGNQNKPKKKGFGSLIT